jgi:hypothetical protein
MARDGQSSRVGTYSDEHTTQLPPLPGTTQFTKAVRLPPSATSRADEFENFKKSKGAEINRILCENKSEFYVDLWSIFGRPSYLT